jgi:hypothetical protein
LRRNIWCLLLRDELSLFYPNFAAIKVFSIYELKKIATEGQLKGFN